MKSIDKFIIEDALGALFVGIVVSLFAGVLFGTVGGCLGKILQGKQ